MRWSKDDLDARTEEVLVDAYGDDEQAGSFACVIEELIGTGVIASVLGEDVELVSVSDEEARLGLRAVCRRAGRAFEVALVDVELGPGADPDLDLTLSAYRRWARGQR